MAGYITVLLQKSNPAGDWGFKMGSVEPAASVVITQIDQSCVAAELLEPGDRIIEIEGMETSKLSIEELQSILGNPCKKLSMVVLKKTLPKGNCTIRKTTREEVETVEETREEVERKKEYEVLLEVDPKECVDDVIRNVKDKIARGEKLDAKEMQIKTTLNKNVQQSTSTFDSTRTSIRRDYEKDQYLQMQNQPRNSEILKRREKYMREQKKEEMVKYENIKQEKAPLEEKKKKSNSFWTDPPSDLKDVIKSSKFWKPRDSSEHITTSTIFSQLNDLHNIQRKTSAREEKRLFWENCRKKYGLDPPGSKYNVSHRSDLQCRQDEANRSKSCEPEHLDSRNPFKREDYRETNPFYSPSPTNPFYAECNSRTQSQEHLGSTTLTTSGPMQETLSQKPRKIEEDKNIKLSQETKNESCEKTDSSQESHREDFNSKCEFFERQTSVPTTSCAKNAQDLVSERLGAQKAPGLRKPSDFINQIQAENRRASLSGSIPQEEQAEGAVRAHQEVERQRSSSLIESTETATEESGSNLTEHKAFLGQSVLRQSASGSVSTSNEVLRLIDLARESVPQTKVTSSQQDEKKDKSEVSEKSEMRRGLKSQQSMEEEIKNHPLVVAALEKERAATASLLQETAQQIEADMKESIDRIRAESEKLCSLDLKSQETVSCQQQELQTQPEPLPQTVHPQVTLIPDSTAFPGLLSGDFHKKSLVETSYEKVTWTGTPYENVESAWGRELRVATPSGFYDNSTEVFRQEALAGGLRHVPELVAQAFRGTCEGHETDIQFSSSHMIEGMKSGEFQVCKGSMIEAGSK